MQIARSLRARAEIMLGFTDASARAGDVVRHDSSSVSVSASGVGSRCVACSARRWRSVSETGGSWSSLTRGHLLGEDVLVAGENLVDATADRVGLALIDAGLDGVLEVAPNACGEADGFAR